MIATLSKNGEIICNKLVVEPSQREKVEELHHLYSKIDFAYGYLQHGSIFFCSEKPKEVLITSEEIRAYDSHRWGEHGINGYYPIELFTTRAWNTLIIIRRLLGKVPENCFRLADFFVESSKEVHACGVLASVPFDLSIQTKKLEYILGNRDIALSLLKDAYLDFYLFVDLLAKVELETEAAKVEQFDKDFYVAAEENTLILNIAQEFALLRRKQNQ